MSQSGIYIHIPYCLQRCHYCDFTTFEADKILPQEDYVDWLCREIRARSEVIPFRQLTSIYFGGGTPSLLPASSILAILDQLNKAGFEWSRETEVTIEINPATVDENKLNVLLNGGINRFSLGAQSFSDRHLKACGRRHNADQTRDSLRLFHEQDVNYSFDLLFALPNQTMAELQQDLDEISRWDPPHLSAYCLTVPEGHPMSYNRPEEQDQLDMFDAVDEHLDRMGIHKYELSNFSKPGMQSKHNQLYWSNKAYWGLGLSAHSYFPDQGLGRRFWNPKSFKDYFQQIELSETSGPGWWSELSGDYFEDLQEHEALTDYCHMHLRTMKGLNLKDLSRHPDWVKLLEPRLNSLNQRGFIRQHDSSWQLTKSGQRLSNQVYAELLFLREDLDRSSR
ncbi:MAG: coproporphyrinogen III oxidase [Bdellovibrionaceae bacterium]|nr:coproporphyrinogen III oxidase [Pseudobdellovibrionaceae bacterium]